MEMGQGSAPYITDTMKIWKKKTKTPHNIFFDYANKLGNLENEKISRNLHRLQVKHN